MSDERLRETGNGPSVSYEEALLRQHFGDPDSDGVYGGGVLRPAANVVNLAHGESVISGVSARGFGKVSVADQSEGVDDER